MKYMQRHGYAIRNQGTAWSGIPACMKAFGLTDVRNVASMTDVFALLRDGYCAVFLMRAGSRGGVTWTTSGHYIAVTDYKVKNGRHYFYTRDPGGRRHTGWYCYEEKMKGLIPQVWVGMVPKKKDKDDTKKKSAVEKKRAAIAAKAVECSYPYGTARSRYTYPTGAPKKEYKAALNKAYPDRSSWGKQTRAGASCDVAAGTFVRASGADRKMPRGLDEQLPYLARSKKWKSVRARDGVFRPSELQAGDLILCRYPSGTGHICTVVEKKGVKYVAEAGYHTKRWPVLAKKLQLMKKSSYRMLKVYRRK